MSKRSLVDAHQLVSEGLPSHLKHFEHTTLFESLVPVLEEFVGGKVLGSDVASELIEAAALALEEEFEKAPVSLTALDIGPGTGICNYRFDSGYWQFVVRGPLEVELEGVQTVTGLLGIEGTGGSLTKGRATAQGLRAAHTRQQALDGKAAARASGQIEQEEPDSWDDE